MTIYQKTPGALIPQGGRTVATFPSGLCRVDQTFICPTSNESTHRAALAVGNDFPGDDAPSVVGLKIFPDVQEVRGADGFTEFRVSGYGRTGEEGRNVQLLPLYFDARFIELDGTWYAQSELTEEESVGTTIRDLDIRFYLNEIRGDIVGQLTDPQGNVNLPLPIDVLDAQGLTATTGWVVETLTNVFASTSAEGYFRAVLRDNVSERVEIIANINRIAWEIESERNYGAIGEYSVFGRRSVRNYTITRIV
jgi:hypothetical protein